MNKKLAFISTLAVLLTFPIISLAYTGPSQPQNGKIVLDPSTIIDGVFAFIWPIVTAIVVIMFIAAGFLFLTAQGDPGKAAAGRQAVIYGVVGVIVILLGFSIVQTLKYFLSIL